MIKEYDKVKVFRFEDKKKSIMRNLALRKPKIGDVGTVVSITGSKEEGFLYTVECAGEDGKSIWIADFKENEILKIDDKINHRNVEFDVNPLFPNRWSPRALSGEPIDDKTLFTLFEAARGAPSSYNNQPWKFVYAKRDTHSWDTLFNLMGEFNQSWVKNAAVLIVVVSKNNFHHNEKPSRTHSFDTGAAWQSLALQASLIGLVAHGMEGFDYEKAKKDLHIPDDYTVEAMVAIGKPGRKEDLPAALQEKEVPSDRKLAKEFVFEGRFIKK